MLSNKSFIWVICASLSVLSARHLLVEQNIHYPLQLYFNQLVATGLIDLWSFFRRHNDQKFPCERSPSRWLMTRGTVLITMSKCLTGLSTICTLQAILHFQNLPTFLVMILIAIVAEDLLLFHIRIVPNTRMELLRISLTVVAAAGLLSTEYLLTPANLEASILAMLLAGAGRALWKAVFKYHPDTVANNSSYPSRSVIIGALTGVTWVFLFWSGEPIFAFDFRNVPLLTINASTAALAQALGRSILLPMYDEVADSASRNIDSSVHGIWDAPTFTILTGIVGIHSTLSLRRSYTNVYQFCFFLIAIACIGTRGHISTITTQLKTSSTAHSMQELESFSSVPPVEDSAIVSSIDEADYSRQSALLQRSQNNAFRRSFLGICVASLWTAYGIMNFTERSDHHLSASLDRDYLPESSVDIVLNMYKEPVNEVVELIYNLKRMPAFSNAHVITYIKDKEADTGDIQRRTGADDIIQLPNIGREGETFLNHILNRWDTLARQTVFLQAGIHNPGEFYSRINNYYSRFQTGFLNLGWSGAVCDCKHCGDRLFWEDNLHILPRLHQQVYNSTICGNVLLSYKGQFFVSAARIRGIDKSIYHSLWQAFVDPKSWAHQHDCLQGRPDSMNAPDFGFTMERIWNLLFQCSDVNIAWKCPSLVSRWRIGGNMSDCQCFDA